ncbi:MAG: PAS domain S-box protein [Fidelibacterota bacterium]
MELVRRKKSGESIIISVSTAPFFDKKGNMVGSMATVEDITERKRNAGGKGGAGGAAAPESETGIHRHPRQRCRPRFQ